MHFSAVLQLRTEAAGLHGQRTPGRGSARARNAWTLLSPCTILPVPCDMKRHSPSCYVLYICQHFLLQRAR
eukprot:6278227-Alexandrium_andersonii.AAC.1